MVRYAVGSNQYRTKAANNISAATPDLVSQVNGRLRCGQVWGTRCQAWVAPPDYSHNHCGMNGNLYRAALRCSIPEALQLLASQPNNTVRLATASNPQCPPSSLAMLATDSETLVRRRALRHPRCPENMIRLYADKEPHAVVDNPMIPPDILEHFAQSSIGGLRMRVAKHVNTPPGVLVRLLSDPEPMVRRIVHDNPALPEEYRMLGEIAR